MLSPAPFASLALGALLLLGASGLSHAAPEGESAPGKEAAEASNRFALDFYGQVRQGEGNLFFSPLSISTALAMTREGAKGETAAEMDRVLHFQHFPDQLSLRQEALRLALKPPLVDDWSEGGRKQVPAYDLAVANRLWGAQDASFVPGFLKTLEGAYAAPLSQLDFRQGDAARAEINGWIATQTHERIKDILKAPQPLPNTRLVLANAIYFKAGWTSEFPQSATQDSDWRLESGEQARAQLMHTTADFGYAETETAQLLELSYRGGETSMVVILPKGPAKLSAIEGALDAPTLAGWLGQVRRQKVEVHLPRFKFTTPALSLKETLQALGMKRAFESSQADFSGMSSEGLFIGAVVHKAFIAVDEEGTEAAAATVVMMGRESVQMPVEPKRFRADHPFLFVIRHRRTGAILFMGRLVQP